MRRLATAAVGLSIAVFVVGAALFVLTQPPLTRLLAARFALAEQAGLPRERMLSVAEQVRAFVAGSGASLPGVVDGRPGFDAAAVSHLEDVRSVIGGARVVTLVLAALLALWLWLELARGRADRIAEAMGVAAWWCLGLVVLAVAAGIFSFDALFTAFHGLFFAEGTWTFAFDSLLIQTFPEPFWAAAAGLWAGIVLLGGGALWAGARAIRLSEARVAPVRKHESTREKA